MKRIINGKEYDIVNEESKGLFIDHLGRVQGGDLPLKGVVDMAMQQYMEVNE